MRQGQKLVTGARSTDLRFQNHLTSRINVYEPTAELFRDDANTQKDRHTNIRTDRQKDRHTKRLTDWQTDNQQAKQTYRAHAQDIHTERQTDK